MAVFFKKRNFPYLPGKAITDYAVGESVYLVENGSAVEYIVVNQGNPDTSLYDASCDGVWVMRKDLLLSAAMGSSRYYDRCDMHTYLNETFHSTLSDESKAVVQQVQIPYCSAGSGSSGTISHLTTYVFLLSFRELGWTNSNSSYAPKDGAKLAYFTGAASERDATLNGSSTTWWLRSTFLDTGYYYVQSGGGGFNSSSYTYSRGIRPAFILSKKARFDTETNIVL